MKKYQNPPDRWPVILASLVLVVFLAGAFYLFTNYSSLAAFAFLVVGIMIVIVLAQGPVLRRPKSIGFTDEGIMISLPRNKERVVKWDRITNIHVVEGSPKKFLGRIIRGSTVREKGSRAPIELSFELGMLVKDEYFRRFGDRVYLVWTYQTKRKLR